MSYLTMFDLHISHNLSCFIAIPRLESPASIIKTRAALCAQTNHMQATAKKTAGLSSLYYSLLQLYFYFSMFQLHFLQYRLSLHKNPTSISFLTLCRKGFDVDMSFRCPLSYVNLQYRQPQNGNKPLTVCVLCTWDVQHPVWHWLCLFGGQHLECHFDRPPTVTPVQQTMDNETGDANPKGTLSLHSSAGINAPKWFSSHTTPCK